MRSAILTLLACGLLASSAQARHGASSPGNAFLTVRNDCDEAVSVTVTLSAASSFVLEPSGTKVIAVNSGASATVRAELVSDPSVSRKATFAVAQSPLVAISSTVSRSGKVTLSIASDAPTVVGLSRESAVALASTGGLLPLLWLGCLLGRTPRPGLRRMAALGSAATILLGVLLAQPAMANGPPGGPPSSAGLTIVNQCDEAVRITSPGTPAVLEPLGSKSYIFYTTSVKVRVELVSNRSINAEAQVGLRQLRGTAVYVTLVTSPSGKPQLQISSQPPRTALLSRETGVALASTGGLLPLIYLGCLLGRTPQRRRKPDEDVC